MKSWGTSWLTSWGTSWGTSAPAPVPAVATRASAPDGGGGRGSFGMLARKRRQQDQRLISVLPIIISLIRGK